MNTSLFKSISAGRVQDTLLLRLMKTSLERMWSVCGAYVERI
jgi:hypothetical protein